MPKVIEDLEFRLSEEARRQVERSGCAAYCSSFTVAAWVDTGLYRLVRCPNYLGEMVFWTGVLVSGIGALQGIGQWIMALIGYVGIVFVMFSGARRLEIRQNKNYGKDPEYQQCVKTVPILLPFIPLYSVEKYKWLIA
mgnify:CR=1 FL=1